MTDGGESELCGLLRCIEACRCVQLTDIPREFACIDGYCSSASLRPSFWPLFFKHLGENHIICLNIDERYTNSYNAPWPTCHIYLFCCHFGLTQQYLACATKNPSAIRGGGHM